VQETDPVKRTGLAMLVLSGIPAIFCAMGFAMRGAWSPDASRSLSLGAGTAFVVFVVLGFAIYKRSLVALYTALVLSGLASGMSLIYTLRHPQSLLFVAMMGAATWHLWKMSKYLARERA
jgi:hypothetical protein